MTNEKPTHDNHAVNIVQALKNLSVFNSKQLKVVLKEVKETGLLLSIKNIIPNHKPK